MGVVFDSVGLVVCVCVGGGGVLLLLHGSVLRPRGPASPRRGRVFLVLKSFWCWMCWPFVLIPVNRGC